MLCEWCGEKHSNPLSHVCPDGSTLDDRRVYFRDGIFPPPNLALRVSDPLRIRKSEPNIDSKLTSEDSDLLKGMKIKW